MLHQSPQLLEKTWLIRFYHMLVCSDAERLILAMSNDNTELPIVAVWMMCHQSEVEEVIASLIIHCIAQLALYFYTNRFSLRSRKQAFQST